MRFQRPGIVPDDFLPPQGLYRAAESAAHSGGHLHIHGPAQCGKSASVAWLSWKLKRRYPVLRVEPFTPFDMPASFYLAARDVGWIEDAVLACERAFDDGAGEASSIAVFLEEFMKVNGVESLVVTVDDWQQCGELREALTTLPVSLISSGTGPLPDANFPLQGADYSKLLERYAVKRGLATESVEQVCDLASSSFELLRVYCDALDAGLKKLLPVSDLGPAILAVIMQGSGKKFSEKFVNFLDLLSRYPDGVVVPEEEISMVVDALPLLTLDWRIRYRVPEFAPQFGPRAKENPLQIAWRSAPSQNPAMLKLIDSAESISRLCDWVDVRPAHEMCERMGFPRDGCFVLAKFHLGAKRYSKSLQFIEKALSAPSEDSKNCTMFELLSLATRLCLFLKRSEQAKDYLDRAYELGSASEAWWQAERLHLDWLFHQDRDLWRAACRKLVDTCFVRGDDEQIGRALQELMCAQSLYGDFDLATRTAKQALTHLPKSEDAEELLHREMVYLDKYEQWTELMRLERQLPDLEKQPLYLEFVRCVLSGEKLERETVIERLRTTQREEELDWFSLDFFGLEGRLLDCVEVHKRFFNGLTSVRSRLAAQLERADLLFALGHTTEALKELPAHIPCVPVTELRINGGMEELNRGFEIRADSLRAACLDERGDDGAREIVERCLSVLPRLKTTDDTLHECYLRMTLSRVLAREGKANEALDCLQPIPQPRPEWEGMSVFHLTSAHRRRGELRLAAGEPEKALEIFKECRRYLSESRMTLVWRLKFQETVILGWIARAYLALGDEKTAAMLLEQVCPQLFDWMMEERPQVLEVLFEFCDDWLDADSESAKNWLRKNRLDLIKNKESYPSEALGRSLGAMRNELSALA